VKSTYFKPILFFVCLLPLLRLGWKALNSALGANPIQVITFSTGTWTLAFLLITLSVTPLRKLTRLYWLIQYRRMLGLFAFFYGCLHFLTYFWLDQFFDLHSIYKDVLKQPFITAGFTAFVLMIPLAVTSTQKAIRRLGKRWQVLHRLIYASAIAGVAHYIWRVKKDVRVPEIYAGILAALLLYRVAVWALNRKAATSSRKSQATPPLQETSAAAD
jgi:methionine sulfoxide reductase heme-binding subunit